jgi:hypothetical protein
VTEFVVRIDGEQGELFVDGKRAELFGALVGIEVRRDDLNLAPLVESSPFVIRPRERPVIEVTLRFPLGGSDRLTVLRGPRVEDVEGPTADGEREKSA